VAVALSKCVGSEDVPGLITVLDDAEWSFVAISLLGQIGDSRAVPGLLRQLKVDDGERVKAALVALVRIGDRRAAPALQSLARGKEYLREVVLALPAVLGTDSLPLLQSFLTPEGDSKAASSRPTRIRQEAASEALGAMGPSARQAAPALARLLSIHHSRDNPPFALLHAVVESLGKIGGPEAVEALAAVIRCDSSLYLHDGAGKALASMGAEARAAVPAIRSAMCRKAYIESWTIEALGAIGGPAAVEGLADVLRDHNRNGGYGVGPAARALAQIASPAAIEALASSAEHPRRFVRMAVVKALADARSAARVAVPVLIRALKDTSPGVRESAADALGSLGVASPQVVGALVRVLRTEVIHGAIEDVYKGLYVVYSAVTALGRLGPGAAEATPALVEMLTDTRSGDLRHLKWFLTEALERIGAAPPEAIPVLLANLRAGDPRLAGMTGRTIGATESCAPEVVQALFTMLVADESEVRLGAAEALGRLGVRSDDVTGILDAELRSRDDDHCMRAAWTLGRLGIRMDDAIRVLLLKTRLGGSCLEGFDRDSRFTRERILAEMDEKAVDAALERLLAHPNRRVRTAAKNTLRTRGR
jgi:HEAT repeat protein